MIDLKSYAYPTIFFFHTRRNVRVKTKTFFLLDLVKVNSNFDKTKMTGQIGEKLKIVSPTFSFNLKFFLVIFVLVPGNKSSFIEIKKF